MSRKTKTWLIIAASFIIVACIIFVATMSMLDWKFIELNTTKYEANTYTVNESFENISINTNTTNIVFLKSNDQTCKIECFEYEKEKHAVTVIDNTLKINLTDTRDIYDHITFFDFGDAEIMVYLPQEKYESLTVNLSTGDIEISNNFSFENIDINGSTSDINLENIIAGNINLAVTTGDVDVTNVNCKTFIADSSTGDCELENVVAKEELKLTCDTGDIEIDACDAGEIFIKTNTGDVKGSLMSEKVFACSTSTGNVEVPKTTSGGKCEIVTNTGDIKIKIGK